MRQLAPVSFKLEDKQINPAVGSGLRRSGPTAPLLASFIGMYIA
jgi:hypothetical protein